MHAGEDDPARTDGQNQYKDRIPRGRVDQNDTDKWRKYVHGVANPRIEDRTELNHTSSDKSSTNPDITLQCSSSTYFFNDIVIHIHTPHGQYTDQPV